MEESILGTIAKMVYGDQNDDYFDPDLIVHINTALAILFRIGVGMDRKSPFMITGTSETWGDLLGDEYDDLQSAITLVYLKVKLVFDPPTASIVFESMKTMADELESTINYACEQKRIDKAADK